jgi:hypothetical protein
MATPGVPFEFVGRARTFRARVGAEDDAIGRAVLEIMRPLQARRRRSKTFRPADLVDAERQFRQLPSAGRLSLKVERDKTGLRIEELRCASGKIRFAEWQNGATDPDIGIMRIALEATSWGPAFVAGDLIASLSLHALARRYQRGFRTDDAAIMSELKAMALCHADIVETRGDFAVGGSGGNWVGEVGLRDSMPVLAVRSFKPAGAAVSGVAWRMRRWPRMPDDRRHFGAEYLRARAVNAEPWSR